MTGLILLILFVALFCLLMWEFKKLSDTINRKK
jgi:O-antigen ligase